MAAGLPANACNRLAAGLAPDGSLPDIGVLLGGRAGLGGDLEQSGERFAESFVPEDEFERAEEERMFNGDIIIFDQQCLDDHTNYG